MRGFHCRNELDAAHHELGRGLHIAVQEKKLQVSKCSGKRTHSDFYVGYMAVFASP